MTRLLLVCLLAASAGIHSALAAEHGVSFHVAAGLLALAAGTLALRPGRVAAAAAGLVLAGLLGAYLAAGEGLDAVAGATKTIETAGLVLAVRLTLSASVRPPERLVTLVAAALIAVFAAAVTPPAAHDHAPGAPPHGH